MITISDTQKSRLSEILEKYDFGCFSINSNKPNQDNYICSFSKNKFLLAVADGIGGLPEGSKSSQVAIDCLSKLNIDDNISKEEILGTFLEIRKILESIKKYKNLDKEIGTTLTIAYIDEERISVFHTGDSRLYLFSNNRIFFRTTDQTISELNEFIKGSNIITSAIISNKDLNVTTNFFDRKSIESAMLMTDGVYRSLGINKIEYFKNTCKSSNIFSETIKSYLTMRGVEDDSTMVSLSLRQ